MTGTIRCACFNDDGAIELTTEDFERAGGLSHALSKHADAGWDRVKDTPRQARLTPRLYLLLCDVTPDGQITRRCPQVAEVESVAEASPGEIAEVMRIFQEDDRNFLLPPAGTPFDSDVRLDISHESLIRHWKRFNDWLNEERVGDALARRHVR